ncbi:MAG TPA: insulinase family protein [Devosiaceae bacterium]
MTKHDFDLIAEKEIPEIHSLARHYRHRATGGEVLSLLNDDENKVFGITFRTPPADSTGVAHILEHSVLCGSRKYPLKEPFVELLKGSLHTFLNAMTFADKTAYPVASQNLADFYNLVDVYLDAVFFPRLTEDTFRQEGWHYELDNAADPLVFKGVVFNEMKGVFSSPEARLADVSQRSLFPDTTYGVSSGGNPRVIPDLTYEAFRDFHSRLYHPSNARAFFYGDDDPEKRLDLIGDYFAEFERREPDSGIATQGRFTAPRHIEATYPGSAAEGAARDGMVTVNWLLDLDVLDDMETALGLAVLNHALIGTPGSPLRRALTDSGLGESMLGGGISDGLKQPTASFGLKGIDPANAGKVEALILETLGQLAAEGIDEGAVTAALNTLEFQLRENNTGSYPRGLVMMFRALGPWLHDRDPMSALEFEGPLETVKAKIAEGGYFERIIRRHLLDNAHRTTVVLRADPDLAETEAAEERARLEAVRVEMDAAGLEATVEMTERLKALQEATDPEDVLAKVPSLRIEDLPRASRVLPIERATIAGVPAMFHDLPTNGIAYLDLGFDLTVLDADLLAFVPLFSRALTQTGTKRRDFVELSQLIGQTTGGLRTQRWSSSTMGGDTSAWLFVRGKATGPHVGDLVSIMAEVLGEARLDNRERIRQMVLEEKAGFEGRLTGMGSHLVDLRLRASLGEADWLGETFGGISHLMFLRRLADLVDSDFGQVQGALERIRSVLLTRPAMLINITAEGGDRAGIETEVARLVGGIPAEPRAKAVWDRRPGAPSEGLTMPAQVNYVGKGADLYRLGYKPNGAASVAVKYLNTTYLWDKVRVQGGAYGGFARFDQVGGGLTFASYRDPNLVKTLDAFDGAASFLRRELGSTELVRSIIGTIGEVDRYMLPDAKGFASMLWALSGNTDDVRQTRRDQILSAGPGDFRQFAEALQEVARAGHVVVLGSEKAIAEANTARNGFLDVSKVL